MIASDDVPLNMQRNGSHQHSTLSWGIHTELKLNNLDPIPNKFNQQERQTCVHKKQQLPLH